MTGTLRGVSNKHCLLFFFHLNRIFFILASNEDIHNISDEFEIWPDRTKDCGVSCPLASGKIPIDL